MTVLLPPPPAALNVLLSNTACSEVERRAINSPPSTLSATVGAKGRGDNRAQATRPKSSLLCGQFIIPAWSRKRFVAALCTLTHFPHPERHKCWGSAHLPLLITLERLPGVPAQSQRSAVSPWEHKPSAHRSLCFNHRVSPGAANPHDLQFPQAPVSGSCPGVRAPAKVFTAESGWKQPVARLGRAVRVFLTGTCSAGNIDRVCSAQLTPAAVSRHLQHGKLKLEVASQESCCWGSSLTHWGRILPWSTPYLNHL